MSKEDLASLYVLMQDQVDEWKRLTGKEMNPAHIWNLDEENMRFDSRGKVLSKKGSKNNRVLIAACRDSFRVQACCNPAGRTLSCFLVLKGKILPPWWASLAEDLKDTSQDRATAAATENAYMTTFIFQRWFLERN